jgi:phosphate uptake regulator
MVMRRKIVKLGPSTLVVSLPSKWVNKTSLGSGDEVEMIEEEGHILISPVGNIISDKKTEVDLKEINNLIQRLVVAKYLEGYDEIKVYIDNIQKSRIIQKRVKDLIGMAVVSQGKDFIVIKEISQTTDLSLDVMLRRIFLLIKQIGEESLAAIKQKETNLEYLADMEENINNFTDYCFRILNKRGFSEYGKTPVMYCVTSNLELIGDEYKKLLKYLTKNKLKLDSQLTDLYKKICSLFDNLYSFFYEFSNKKAASIADDRDIIMNKITLLQSKTKSAQEMAVLKNFENLTELIIRTMGLVLNLN